MSYNKIIEELIAENEKLKSNINLNLARNFELQKEKRYWLDNFKRLRDDKIELKKANEKLQDEHEQLKQRVFKLVRTNTNLQNDLFSEQLLQDETDEYINRLKQELFNLYLNHYN